MRRLPVDLSTFSRLRELNCVYVDKTEHLYNMITQGQRYFLSRPRRFGKSLLVSTFKEILTGNKKLFDDLWIGSSDYDWREHGVIDLDFSKLVANSVETFEESLRYMLAQIANFYNITLAPNIVRPERMLNDIVCKLSSQYGRVAILIDEYDSPIIKTLHDERLAQQIRDKIQQFFTIIKSLDAHVQFVFIAGVSSLIKAGLFSGMNNAQVITLDEQFATICGYTDKEVDLCFSDHMNSWAEKAGVSCVELRQQIKEWYSGYRFGINAIEVYNPSSLMKALKAHKFENFWFESGMPTFLVNILKTKYKNFNSNSLQASEEYLQTFDVNASSLLPVLFQAGYLTIVGYDEYIGWCKLDYPNFETKRSLQKYLFEIFPRIDAAIASQRNESQML